MKFDLDDTPDRPTDWKTERAHSAAYLEALMPELFEDEPANIPLREGFIMAIEALEGKK